MTTHTPTASGYSLSSSSWYVIENSDGWGIAKEKRDNDQIVQRAVKEYMASRPKHIFKNSMGFPDLPGFPGSRRLCDECNETPYDKIEIGVTEHYFCNDCHTKWKAHLPEELFEI